MMMYALPTHPMWYVGNTFPHELYVANKSTVVSFLELTPAIFTQICPKIDSKEVLPWNAIVVMAAGINYA